MRLQKNLNRKTNSGTEEYYLSDIRCESTDSKTMAHNMTLLHNVLAQNITAHHMRINNENQYQDSSYGWRLRQCIEGKEYSLDNTLIHGWNIDPDSPGYTFKLIKGNYLNRKEVIKISTTGGDAGVYKKCRNL